MPDIPFTQKDVDELREMIADQEEANGDTSWQGGQIVTDVAFLRSLADRIESLLRRSPSS